MKLQRLLLFTGLAGTLSCAKTELPIVEETRDALTVDESEPPTRAAKIPGLMTCFIDEDILRAAVIDYYGLSNVRNVQLMEYDNIPSSELSIMEGVIESRTKKIHFAFQLIPIPDGEEGNYYLPYAGTEQHVEYSRGDDGEFVITSSTEGYCDISSGSPDYSTSLSTNKRSNVGTNKLVKLLD